MNRIHQIEPVLGPEERDAVLAVMDSGFITEGRVTREFEATLAKFLDVPFAVTVNNATVGLAIALRGLGIGPGDEVIVPDFTFIATANAVTLAGAIPIFADVRRDTFVLDIEDTRRRISPRTKAIIPVHLNGRGADMEQLIALARQHGLFVVEDAAQALGSSQCGRYLGTFGDAGVFSLGTTKIITTGQGGVIVTHDRERYEAFVRIKDHGRLSRSAEVHDTLGMNSKFTDLQAALGLAQLAKLPGRMAQKRRIFAWCREMLAGAPGIAIPPMDLRDSVPWFADVVCERRPALQTHLEGAGIETRRFYLPVHSQPCYRAAGAFPNTEHISSRGLWLPSSVSLTRPEVESICGTILAFSAGHEARAAAPAQVS